MLRRCLLPALCALLLVFAAACDSGGPDRPAPVDLPLGTFKLTLSGDVEDTFEGEAAFSDAGPFPFLLTLGAPQDGAFVQLSPVQGKPAVGTYPVSRFPMTATFSGEPGLGFYIAQSGTVEIASVEDDAFTGRIDAGLRSSSFSGDETNKTIQMRGAFHAMRDTSGGFFALASPAL